MAKKKVMLFIVEGPTDETSLSTVLNRIFSSSTVKFQVVHGDILTRDFTSSDKIVAAVWEQVKEFMGSIYRKSDICRIVHLTDMDGVFIPDDAVVENDTVEIDTPPYYTETQIQTPNGCATFLLSGFSRASGTGRAGTSFYGGSGSPCFSWRRSFCIKSGWKKRMCSSMCMCCFL